MEKFNTKYKMLPTESIYPGKLPYSSQFVHQTPHLFLLLGKWV